MRQAKPRYSPTANQGRSQERFQERSQERSLGRSHGRSQRRPGLPDTPTWQSGYLLIKVMVAILIGTIGVIGLTTASVKAGRVNTAAAFQSELALAGRSMFSILDLHLENSESGNLSIRIQPESDDQPNVVESLDSGLQSVMNQVARTEPSIEAAINCDEVGARRCEICFNWYEREGAATAEEHGDSAISLNRQACRTQLV